MALQLKVGVLFCLQSPHSMAVDSDSALTARVLSDAEGIRVRQMAQATDRLVSVLAQRSQPVVLERAEGSGGDDVQLAERGLSLPDQARLDMLEPAHNGNPILDQISQQAPPLDCSHGKLHSHALLTFGYSDHDHFFRPTCTL